MPWGSEPAVPGCIMPHRAATGDRNLCVVVTWQGGVSYRFCFLKLIKGRPAVSNKKRGILPPSYDCFVQSMQQNLKLRAICSGVRRKKKSQFWPFGKKMGTRRTEGPAGPLHLQSIHSNLLQNCYLAQTITRRQETARCNTKDTKGHS